MATISITSNDGALDSASAVLEVTATNPEFNQPALRIKQASCRGGAASIRIDDPNPDIQINGRNASNSGFETILVVQRLATGGNIGLRTRSQFGAGQGVIAIANAAIAPSVNPSNGGILYVEDGALKYRGSEGTVTVIAPA